MVTRTTGWGIGHTASSGALILTTTDGGQTWEDRTPPDPLASDPVEAESAWGYFADENTALVLYASQSGSSLTEAPVIWRTADGGNTWQASAPLSITGNEAWFTPEAFAFADGQTGWLLVHVGAGMSHDYSELFTTADGGATWVRIADPYGSGLQSLHNTGIAFADPQFGWVTKDNLGVMPGAFLEQTADGGATWEDVFLPPPPDFDWVNNLSQCATQSPVFLTPQTGLVIVNCQTFDENPPRTWIYRTTNRGADWPGGNCPPPQPVCCSWGTTTVGLLAATSTAPPTAGRVGFSSRPSPGTGSSVLLMHSTDGRSPARMSASLWSTPRTAGRPGRSSSRFSPRKRPANGTNVTNFRVIAKNISNARLSLPSG